MLIRRLQHKVLIGLTKLLAGLAPVPSYLVFAGRDSAAQLCAHIARAGFRKVLVVSDAVLVELGVTARASAGLADHGLDYVCFDGVTPDPSYRVVTEGLALLREHGSEAIVAIGGGSSIDAAKIIAAAATNGDQPRSWIGFSKFKIDALPIFAMPTTSGTGSEVTMGAVISDSETHQKGVIAHPSLQPAALALDPVLVSSMPPHIAAATGMDALTHAVEAYIGVWDRGDSLERARIAVKLIFAHLEAACSVDSSPGAREGMALAAMYAGMAINLVNVGNVHAIAHALGGRYGIPHGLANAMALVPVLEFSRPAADERLAELACAIGLGRAGASEAELAGLFIDSVRQLAAAVGIASTTDKLREDEVADLARAAVEEGRSYPVPRLLGQGDAETILRRLMARRS